jgi:hypothetical protein
MYFPLGQLVRYRTSGVTVSPKICMSSREITAFEHDHHCASAHGAAESGTLALLFLA